MAPAAFILRSSRGRIRWFWPRPMFWLLRRTALFRRSVDAIGDVTFGGIVKVETSSSPREWPSYPRQGEITGSAAQAHRRAKYSDAPQKICAEPELVSAGIRSRWTGDAQQWSRHLLGALAFPRPQHRFLGQSVALGYLQACRYAASVRFWFPRRKYWIDANGQPPQACSWRG